VLLPWCASLLEALPPSVRRALLAPPSACDGTLPSPLVVDEDWEPQARRPREANARGSAVFMLTMM
jgi:hypothetical protein